MNMEQLKEFVALEKRKRDLDSELKATGARLDDLEQARVPQFLADGVASMKVDGRTVYIAQDIHASPANDRAEVIAALKRSELGPYVSENTTRSRYGPSCAKSPKKRACVASSRTGSSRRRKSARRCHRRSRRPSGFRSFIPCAAGKPDKEKHDVD
jgi:hypothetical protein